MPCRQRVWQRRSGTGVGRSALFGPDQDLCCDSFPVSVLPTIEVGVGRAQALSIKGLRDNNPGRREPCASPSITSPAATPTPANCPRPTSASARCPPPAGGCPAPPVMRPSARRCTPHPAGRRPAAAPAQPRLAGPPARGGVARGCDAVMATGRPRAGRSAGRPTHPGPPPSFIPYLPAGALNRRAPEKEQRAAQPRRKLPYFFPSTNSLNARHKIGAVSGPRLLISPYCAFFLP